MKFKKMNHSTKLLLIYLLSLFFLLSVIVFVPLKPGMAQKVVTPQKKTDTVKLLTKSLDTLIDVSGKKALFIGDSHTVYTNGWQDQLCKKTRMKYKNTAVGGKRTDWMLTQLKNNIDSSYDYCFIWGGANDAASYTPIKETIDNIQKMVNMCIGYGIKPIVLTGFEPKTCIDVSKKDLSKWGFYVDKYTNLQQEIQSKITHSTIIKNHFISRQDGDCSDFICHMSASGHRKMANGIINNLKLKTF